MYLSLRVKLSVVIIIICFLTGMFAILSVYRISANIIDKEYSDKADQITEAVVQTVDPAEIQELADIVTNIYDGVDKVVPSSEWGSDEWNAYMANYEGIEDLPLFQKIRDHLRLYQDIFKVDCIYITHYGNNPQDGSRQSLYLVDGDYYDACPPGVVDAYEDGVWPGEDDPVIHAKVTNEEVYGWLVTSGFPVMNNGKVIAHLFVDIDMNDIKAKEQSYVVTATLIMIGLTIILLILSLLYFNRSVIKPVTMLSETAKNYCSENNDVIHHAFEELHFKTNDEISDLLSSMKQMETDMNSNITSLLDTKVALRETEEKANNMQELAVKDALTGIRNKMAYDHEVRKLEADLADGFNEFGLAMIDLNYLKRTNDTYGHEKGNISIRRLCMLVCEVFEHSPVFRIGGDEFIVVLKFRDYKNVDNLVDDFNARLEQAQNDETLNPWEQISAAIGYAKFDKTVDKTVDDVFKKADQAMYERKIVMKAERKA